MDDDFDVDDLEEEELPEEVLGEEDSAETDVQALVRNNAGPTLHGRSLQRRLDNLGTNSQLARELITQIHVLAQAHGDADAAVAEACSEIEQGIRSIFLELRRRPGATLLGVLSTQEPNHQMRIIDETIELLTARRSRLSTPS